jgi:CheY-like chemotaxis protein
VDACAGPECSTLGAAGLTIRVTDTGPGMTAEQLNRLFTAYDQTSESVARTHGGTGLGLAVSRELARRMGGDLTVESAPGRGSTFILHLPLKAAAPVVTAGPETTQVANELGLRILVVDDHPLNRRTLQLLLDPSGAQIATAEDARSALEQLAAARFDLVLTDVNMPGMCGAGLVRAIRSTPGPNRHTPVIAVTAATSPEEQAACLEAGMTGFVAKPIQPPALYAALNAALAELPGEAAAPKAA